MAAQPPNRNAPYEDSPSHDAHSSASDEDRNAVEVVFDPSSPYRRKSSLVASEALPPRLRRGHILADKTQCIVHHFLNAQQPAASGWHRHHHHRSLRDGGGLSEGGEAAAAAGGVDDDGTAADRHHRGASAHKEVASNSHLHGYERDHDKAHHALPHRPRPTGDHGGHGDEEVVVEPVAVDNAEALGQNRLVEPKGRSAGAPRQRRQTIVETLTSDSEAGQADEYEWAKRIAGVPSSDTDASGAGPSSRAEQPKQPKQPKQPDHPEPAHPEPVQPNQDHAALDIDRVVDEGGDVLHSRLLTKRQLSDMAWGVRELSRRLGSLRLRFAVKTVFLLTKIYDEDLLPKTRELTRWLLSPDRDVRYTVYLERSLRTNKRFDLPGLLDELRAAYGGDADASEDPLAGRLRFWDDAICRARPHTFDMVITLGGDGTVLYASWLFQRIVPPVLSFALGSLGFLTKFDFDDYEAILLTAFRQGVTVSLRLRFEATIMRSQPKRRPALPPAQRRARRKAAAAAATAAKTKAADDAVDGAPGQDEENEVGDEEDEVGDEEDEAAAASAAPPADDNSPPARPRDLVEELIGEEKDDEHTHRPDGTYEILNEVVVDRGPSGSMSYTEIFGDDEHFTSVLADGICVSTPTGSTAYNLAAGGSLCHPENPVMLVTSICAHTLSFRPIILPDTIVLRVGVPYDARTSSWASFDGRERVELQPGDYVTISASRFPFASVQAPGRRSEDWVNSISGKLGWNTRQKQKAYHAWKD